MERGVTPSNEPSVSFCCISLNDQDKLRLLNVPEELHSPFEKLLQRSWHRGIQVRSKYGGALQFKLWGYPWLGQGNDAVPCRLLARDIMAFMYHNGWAIVVATDISKKKGDNDSWFFKRVTADANAQFAAISFNYSDRLRIIGAPENVVRACVECVRTSWKKGIQHERTYDGACELKLRGTPWWSDGHETVAARSLLLHLMSSIESQGWTVYASLDISRYEHDVDSWILKSAS